MSDAVSRTPDARTGLVAAVDLGATSGRVIVGRVGPDTLDSEVITRFPNDPVSTIDGLHWNILGLWGAVTRGLRDAFRVEPGIRSIGVDSWGVDYALLRDGRMLGAPFHYRDDRNGRGVERVHALASHAELFARNGLQYLPFNTLYQLAIEPSELLAIADTVLLTPDLVGFWLTGIARAERTNASTTGLLGVDGGEWDNEVARLVGVPTRILPELIDPGERLGDLLPDVARALGAPAGISVTAVGSHDTASAVVAVPMRPDAAAYISCGTWGLVGVELERPVLTAAARNAGFTNERGVDGRIRLLQNVMGLWILSETLRTWEAGESLPALLVEAAAITTPVPVFDVDDSRFLPPGDMAGRIAAWCEEHGLTPPCSRAEYVRSIVESLAEAFARAAHEAAALGGVTLETIHIVGGGALNTLLCQRTADRAGRPVLAGPIEATSLGNLLVQARSLGLITGSLESLRDLVARTHTPTLYNPRVRGA